MTVSPRSQGNTAMLITAIKNTALAWMTKPTKTVIRSRSASGLLKFKRKKNVLASTVGAYEITFDLKVFIWVNS